MKAEERHRLKTNELAQKLSELPDYLRKHSKYITIGIAVVVVVCVAGGFWWNARKKGQQSRNEELQNLFPQITQVQIMAVRAAQDPGAKPTSGGSSYNTSSVLGSLQTLSTDAKGTGVGMTALMQQAELKRSELYYTNRKLTDAMRNGICQEAETLYNQILEQYGDHAVAVGAAKLGLALVAEDRGEWDKAKKAYQEILAEQDGKLTGTTYPLQAKRRLRMIDEIAIEIDFPYIEPVEAIVEPTKADLMNLNGILTKTGGGLEPIKIELPEVPKPKIKPEVKLIGPVEEKVPAEKESAPEKPVKQEAPAPVETPTEKDEKKDN